MKIKCGVIEDLLPLYQDKVCSEESIALIEKHLEECENCKKLTESMQIEFAVSEETEEKSTNKYFKKGFKKIKRRFAIILICVLILMPVLVVVGRLTVNEIKKEGVAFSNIDDIKYTKKFLENIKNGNFEKAFSLIDRADDYYSILEPIVFHDPMEDYEKIVINGETWYINNDCMLYDSYDKSRDIFDQIFELEYEYVLIPADVFEKRDLPEQDKWRYRKVRWDEKIYYIISDYVYDIYEYGELPEEDSLNNKIEKLEYYDVINSSMLVPEKALQEYVEAQKTSILEHEKYIEENFGNVLDMTLDEFEKYKAKKESELFESLKNKGKYIDKIKFNTVILEGSDWVVYYNVRMRTAENKFCNGIMGLYVLNGKIVIKSISSHGDDALIEAFYYEKWNQE